MPSNFIKGGIPNYSMHNITGGHTGRQPGMITREAAMEAYAAQAGYCLAFFASVIKSGEPWTATCQAEYDKVNAKFRELPPK